jgi:hypothetical protein
MGNLTCSRHTTYLHTIYVKSREIHILSTSTGKSCQLLQVAEKTLGGSMAKNPDLKVKNDHKK